jgi:hypothetical protein
VRWRLEELLVRQPGLRIDPAASDLVLAGRLAFTAQIPGRVQISDCYQIEFRIPETFPRRIPGVFETGGRIPLSYHHLQDGSLCLGSETRLRLMLSEGLSLVGFVDRCLIPYLYRYSYLVIHGEAPFEDLEHGVSGIKEDLRQLLQAKQESEVLPFIRLLGMKRRHANKERCPCGSGDRFGRCHHRHLNHLRERLGRYWFRIVEQQLLNEELTGKSAGIQGPVMRWRPGGLVSDVLSEQLGRKPVRWGGIGQSSWMRPDVVPGFHAHLSPGMAALPGG